MSDVAVLDARDALSGLKLFSSHYKLDMIDVSLTRGAGLIFQAKAMVYRSCAHATCLAASARWQPDTSPTKILPPP